MSAYGIEYLDDAMRNLGEMTDMRSMPVGWIWKIFGNCFLQPGMQKNLGKVYQE